MPKKMWRMKDQRDGTVFSFWADDDLPQDELIKTAELAKKVEVSKHPQKTWIQKFGEMIPQPDSYYGKALANASDFATQPLLPEAPSGKEYIETQQRGLESQIVHPEFRNEGEAPLSTLDPYRNAMEASALDIYNKLLRPLTSPAGLGTLALGGVAGGAGLASRLAGGGLRAIGGAFGASQVPEAAGAITDVLAGPGVYEGREVGPRSETIPEAAERTGFAALGLAAPFMSMGGRQPAPTNVVPPAAGPIPTGIPTPGGVPPGAAPIPPLAGQVVPTPNVVGMTPTIPFVRRTPTKPFDPYEPIAVLPPSGGVEVKFPESIGPRSLPAETPSTALENQAIQGMRTPPEPQQAGPYQMPPSSIADQFTKTGRVRKPRRSAAERQPFDPYEPIAELPIEGKEPPPPPTPMPTKPRVRKPTIKKGERGFAGEEAPISEEEDLRFAPAIRKEKELGTSLQPQYETVQEEYIPSPEEQRFAEEYRPPVQERRKQPRYETTEEDIDAETLQPKIYQKETEAPLKKRPGEKGSIRLKTEEGEEPLRSSLRLAFAPENFKTDKHGLTPTSEIFKILNAGLPKEEVSISKIHDFIRQNPAKFSPKELQTWLSEHQAVVRETKFVKSDKQKTMESLRRGLANIEDQLNDFKYDDDRFSKDAAYRAVLEEQAKEEYNTYHPSGEKPFVVSDWINDTWSKRNDFLKENDAEYRNLLLDAEDLRYQIHERENSPDFSKGEAMFTPYSHSGPRVKEEELTHSFERQKPPGEVPSFTNDEAMELWNLRNKARDNLPKEEQIRLETLMEKKLKASGYQNLEQELNYRVERHHPLHIYESETADVNRIAHPRFDQRQLTSGEQTTTLSETQSDWMRDIRRYGEKSPVDLIKKYELQNKRGELSLKREKAESVKDVRDISLQIKALDDEITAINTRAGKYAAEERTIAPPALSKDWIDFTMKRGLVKAAKDGSKFFSWSQGKTISDRYSGFNIDKAAINQYDKKMVNYMNDLAEKNNWPVRVVEKKIPGESNLITPSGIFPDIEHKVWAMEITPEMAEQLKTEGLPTSGERYSAGARTFIDRLLEKPKVINRPGEKGALYLGKNKSLQNASEEASTSIRELIFPIEHELRKTNDKTKTVPNAGDQLADNFLRARLTGEHYAGRSELKVQNALEGITDEEFGVPIKGKIKPGNVFDILKSNVTPMSPKVAKAATSLQNVMSKVASDANAAGIPQKRWYDITKVKGYYPGYERTPGAIYKYIRTMNERIAQAEILGPEELARGGQLDTLIQSTSDPDYVMKLVKRVMGKEEPFMPGHVKFVDALRTAAGWMYLSRAGISNLAQTTRIPARAGWKATAQAIAKRITDKQGFYDGALDSGAIVEIGAKSTLEDFGSHSRAFRMYGIESGEKFMRGLSSWAGKAEAQALLEALKRKPNSAKIRSQLSDLLLERDLDPIIQAGKLTDKQLAVAGGRMSELTQGRADPIDLPRMWSSSPFANIFFLYKKYALRENVNMWRAIKNNPTRAIATIAVLNTLYGEAIGDIKESLKGAGLKIAGKDADIGERIRGRGEKRAKAFKKLGVDMDPEVARFLDNHMQVWTLGILPDVWDQINRGDFSGTIPSMAGEITKGAVKTGARLYRGEKEPWAPIGREAISKVPLVGQGLREGVFPPQKRKVGLPTPPKLRVQRPAHP